MRKKKSKFGKPHGKKNPLTVFFPSSQPPLISKGPNPDPLTMTLRDSAKQFADEISRTPFLPATVPGRTQKMDAASENEAFAKINAMGDRVNHPSHYNQGKIEVIEFIEDQNFQHGFHRGNALKYLARAGRKDAATEVQDLEKAIWYIRREIALLKGNPPRSNEMPQERA